MTVEQHSQQPTTSTLEETKELPSINDLKPVLLRMTQDEREHSKNEAFQYLATHFGLTNNHLQQRNRGAKSTIFETRVLYALSDLLAAEYLALTKPRYFRITQSGLSFLATMPEVHQKPMTGMSVNADISQSQPPYVSIQAEPPSINTKTESVPGSRVSLFRDILAEAGTPLHYEVIYERALERLPKEKHFAKRLAYISLHASPVFHLLGDGVFELAPTDNRDTRDRQSKRHLGVTHPRASRRQHDSIPGSRVSLFQEILAEAGTPLHYTTIYERALERLPAEKHFARSLAYITLHRSPVFQLVGEGVFALASQQMVTIDSGGQAVLTYAPQPLLPRDADPRAFFESIMVGREWLKTTPAISAREFYRQMCAYMQLTPGSTVEAQATFDAWYAAGLLNRLDYRRQADSPMQLSIDPAASVAEVRRHCLAYLCQRISQLSHILMALQLLPRATMPMLQTGLSPDQTRASDFSTRLTLLAAFDAVRRDGDAWKLTPVGLAVLETQPPSDFHWHEPEQAEAPAPDDGAAEADDYLLFADFDPPAAAPALAPTPEPPPRLWPDVQEHMRATLVEAIRILFPLNPKATDLTKPHSWRNETYVGQNNGKPVSWKGWSANLWYVDDQYGTIYIDHVENVLRTDYQLELFGKSFVEATASYPAYIVAHVDGLSPKVQALIHNAGFVVRVMGKTVHACIVVSVGDFLAHSEQHWAAQCARLLNFHRSILGGR